MMTGYVQPFEGASLVLERDREAINLYEAQYEADVKAYRIAQASLVSETPCEGTTAGADTEEPIVDEGQQLEENREGTDVEGVKRGNVYRVNDTKEECTTSGNKSRKRDEEEDDGHSTNPTPSTSTSTEWPEKQRRTNSQTLDPITVEDRKQWIDRIASEEETGSNRSLLKDFLSTTGQNRRWTIQQWNAYLKEHKPEITRQVNRLKRRAPM
ncbi:hypothetical protein FRC05_008988 [Tulasnella sp. 425]|nr:hypothetical protein FRC05_008988 [Tulasnella sp. 425]